MYLQQTAIQFANSLIYLLLAKFMLNDLPHAAGFLEPAGSHNPIGPFPTTRFWVEPAWRQLVEHCEAWGIMLEEAYQHDVEDPELGEAHPEDKIIGLANYKTVMAGYWLIATGKAPDTVVDQVYSILKRLIQESVVVLEVGEGMPLDDFIGVLRAEVGQQGTIHDMGYLGASLRIQYLRNSFINGPRASKVIAIDKVIHLQHEEGTMLVWLMGYGVRGGELDRITFYVLELLAGGR